jgi:hypothetical protein
MLSLQSFDLLRVHYGLGLFRVAAFVKFRFGLGRFGVGFCDGVTTYERDTMLWASLEAGVWSVCGVLVRHSKAQGLKFQQEFRFGDEYKYLTPRITNYKK